MLQVQGRVAVRNAHFPALLRLNRCRNGPLVLLPPRKERRLLLHTTDVRFLYHVLRSSQLGLLVISHEDEQGCRWAECKVLGSASDFSSLTHLLLVHDVEQDEHVLVLNRSR